MTAKKAILLENWIERVRAYLITKKHISNLQSTTRNCQAGLATKSFELCIIKAEVIVDVIMLLWWSYFIP